MKQNRFILQGLCVAFITVVPGSAGAQQQNTGSTRWKTFDVNRDQHFNRADIQEILLPGMERPTIDANVDGKKDIADAWYLTTQLTRWDRNSDGAVDALDFVTFAPIVLPAPDAAAASAIIAATLKAATAKVPPDLDAKLRARWKQRVTNADTLAALYQGVAAAAITSHNREVMTWSYAMAASVSPRATYLSDLAFAITYDNRLNDALVLLVRARQLEPALCQMSDNMGFVSSRLGQPLEARTYYQEAIHNCPKYAQYHINLGAVLLKLNMDASAEAAFKKAAEMNPHDIDAMLMAISVKPATTAGTAGFEAQYERLRGSDPDWHDRTPWARLPTVDKIDALDELLAYPILKEQERALNSLRDKTAQRIEALARPVLPKGKACADLKVWTAGAPQAISDIHDVERDAYIQSREIDKMAFRRIAGAQLGADRLYLQLALVVAQSRLASGGKADFNAAIDEFYESKMKDASKRLREGPPVDPMEAQMIAQMNAAGLSLNPGGGYDVDKWEGAVALGFMAIALEGTADGTLDKCDGGDIDAVSNKITQDASVGVSTGFLGIEYKPRTCEFKLQAGQGILVAGTWSPYNGLGAQVGAGYEASVGPVKLSGAQWVKFGSDGSLATETGVQAGIGNFGYGIDSTTQMRAGHNEPLGASSLFADIMACDKS